MARLGRWMAVVALVAPVAAAAQTSTSTVTITGTTSQVTTNPAPQFAPRISGSIVVYTDLRNGNEDVYYTDLSTMNEVQVTTSPANQDLYDVSGQRIVYTDYASGSPLVDVYDLSTASASALPTNGGSEANPGIDGGLVAYEYTAAGGTTSHIWCTDLTTGQSVAVTSGTGLDTDPEVSGQRIVFQRELLGRTDNDIVMDDMSTGTETVVAGTTADEADPDISGNRIVYDAIPAGRTDRDVYIYDITTGTTTHVNLPGNQVRPRISGDIVAFDDDSTGTYNVMLYYVPTGLTYAVTTDSNTDYLNDVDGNRLVYTSDRSGNADIWLFNFTVNVPKTGTGGGGSCPDPSRNACTDDSNLDPVYSGTFTREKGKPKTVTDTFDAIPGEGVVVIRTDRCASATATLNGKAILGSCDLHPGDGDGEGHAGDDGHGDDGGGDGCLARTVKLAAHNALAVKVASKPGCEITFDVYHAPDQCSGDDGHGDDGHGDDGGDHGGDGEHDHGAAGSGGTGSDGASGGGSGSASPRLPTSLPHLHLGGCASGPGPAGLVAFALALLALGLRRRGRPRPVRVRTRRRP